MQTCCGLLRCHHFDKFWKDKQQNTITGCIKIRILSTDKKHKITEKHKTIFFSEIQVHSLIFSHDRLTTLFGIIKNTHCWAATCTRETTYVLSEKEANISGQFQLSSLVVYELILLYREKMGGWGRRAGVGAQRERERERERESNKTMKTKISISDWVLRITLIGTGSCRNMVSYSEIIPITSTENLWKPSVLS